MSPVLTPGLLDKTGSLTGLRCSVTVVGGLGDSGGPRSRGGTGPTGRLPANQDLVDDDNVSRRPEDQDSDQVGDQL